MSSSGARPPSAQPSVPKQQFVVIYRAGAAWQSGVPLEKQALGPHTQYLSSLFTQGTLLLAGPFLDAPGGLLLLTVSGVDEADATVANDPAVHDGIFQAEIRRFYPRFERASRVETPLRGVDG
jgi:uncharacterized protein YciI